MQNKIYTINKLFLLLLLFSLTVPYTVQAQLADTPWPKFHNDIRNTGSTTNFGTTVGKLKWRFKTEAAVVSSPVLDSNGILYVGSDDNNVYAINAKSGAIQWKYKTGGPVRSSAALDINGMLYIGSNDGKLYAFNTNTIDPDDQLTWVPEWTYIYSAGSVGAITSPPTIDENGNILFGSNDGYLYSIDDTPSLNWRQPVGTTWGCPAIDVNATPSRVFIGSWDADFYYDDNDTFYGYDAFYILDNTDGTRETYNRILDNGTVVPSSPYVIPGFACVPGGIQASPVLTADGSVIISWLLTYDDWPTWCYDDYSDNPVWKISSGSSSGYTLPLGGDSTYSTPAMVTDGTYFVTSGPDIYKILPDGGTYYSVATIGDRSECSPAVDGQLNIFLGSNGGYFYAVCADCAETPILWQYPGEDEDPLKIISVGGTETIASIISSPAIGDDERHSVYVGASDGYVYAFYDGLRISGTIQLVDTSITPTVTTPLSGVTVYLTDLTDVNAEVRETKSETDGFYQFPGVLSEHQYEIKVEKVGYVFSPSEATTTIKTKDADNINFEASGGKTISGTITDSITSLAVSGVTVSLETEDGTVDEITTTDASGNYEFTSLSFNTYTITPSKASTGFSPPYQEITIESTQIDSYTADFVATDGFQISGTVIDDITEQGIAGATVTLSQTGSLPETQTTDSNGSYSFVGLVPGTYTLTPSYLAYKFSPTSITKTITTNNVDNVDFYAATGATINGYIFEGTSPLDNETTIELYTLSEYLTGADPSRTSVTNSSGLYSIIGVANGMYIVKPVLEGYSFNPVTKFISLLNNDQNNVNFRATTGLSISGKVSNLFNVPFADIAVTLSGDSTGETTTTSSGQYIFTGLSAGLYTVSVEDESYEITPSSITIDLTLANAENKNFTASPICPVVYLNIPPFGPQGTLVNVYGINFEASDPSNDDTLISIGDTGVSVTPGVYFGYQDPSTWIKAEVEQWLSWRILVSSPGGLGFYNVYVVRTDEDGNGCVYQTPYPTNLFISY